MKATGITRKLDSLGRIVIPKEIRRMNRLGEGASLEIYTDKEGEIILKKYSPMVELGIFAKQYADALSSTIGHTVCIADRDQVIAASGSLKKEYLGKTVSRQLDHLISNRDVIGNGKKYIPLLAEDAGNYEAQAIYPIISEGDAIGAIAIISKEARTRFSDTEYKAAACAASFLGRQMES